MVKDASDLILRIRAGPGYDQENLQVVNVNDEANPILIDSEHFTGYLVVRMHNFNGMTPENKQPIRNPPSNYFKGHHRRYSIMVQGRWKKAWNGDEIIFGIDAASRIRTPTGVNLAVKIAKWLDPGIDVDLSSDQPWVYTAFVAAMNSLAIYRISDPEIWDLTSHEEQSDLNDTSSMDHHTDHPKRFKDIFSKKKNLIHPPSSSSSLPSTQSLDQKQTIDPSPHPFPANYIGRWSFHSTPIPDSTGLLFDAPNAPSLPSYEKRKRHFADPAARRAAQIHTENIYAMDFYDGYFDFNAVCLRLPGFSVNALKYYDGQPLRFVCRTRDRSVTFFAVHFELLEREALGLLGEAEEKVENGGEGGNEGFSHDLLPPPEVLADDGRGDFQVEP